MQLSFRYISFHFICSYLHALFRTGADPGFRVNQFFSVSKLERSHALSSAQYYIGKAQWASLLQEWMDKHRVMAPVQQSGGLFFQPAGPDMLSDIVYDMARAVQPLKSFLMPPLDEVTGSSPVEEKPFLFLNVKACDIKALSILDSALNGEFREPNYCRRREKSIIIGSDCTQPWDTCFCTMVGGKPYPEQGFDLNLTKIWDGFVIEVGSDRGWSLLEGHDQILKVLVKEEATALDKLRKESIKKVEQQNKSYEIKTSLKSLVSRNWESNAWKKHAETCVECGACNHACPTCHCYFLDDVTREAFVKLRGWDACMYSGYAVTAGGGTPRPRLVERFRNRYFCKFKYLDDNYGTYGCTGCGRCIEGCQGKIDMRETLYDLTNSKG